MENRYALIAQKRKEHGLTQAELGTMLGISGKAVSKWERGLSKPCEEHWERLIDLLGLPVEHGTAEPEQTSTFLSTVKSELIRILSAGVMIAVCICNLAEIISTPGFYLAYIDWDEYSLTWNKANQNLWLGIVSERCWAVPT